MIGIDREEFPTHEQYILEELADRLMNAHNGRDNYYTESGPAKEILDFLELNYVQSNKIGNDPATWIRVLNAVLICYVGNYYGYSTKAIDTVEAIIELVDVEVFEEYFKIKGFIDLDMLYELCEDKPFVRWEMLIGILEKRGVDIGRDVRGFKQKDFLDMFYSIKRMREQQKGFRGMGDESSEENEIDFPEPFDEGIYEEDSDELPFDFV